MQQGWIKLHRQLVNKPIWNESTLEQKVILITLLLMANHDEKQWEWKGKKYTASPGQFVTSLSSIAKKAGDNVSIQNVRTALKRFEKYDFLTNDSTNKNRLITIVNWGLYQEKESELTKNLTGDQQAANKQLTTNKNVRMKECKNNNKRHKYEICDMRLAELFFNKILENNPEHKKPNLEKWANDIRLIRERDEKTEEQIQYLIEWVQNHDFWHANVLSPAKLRDKFDQLVMQVKRDHHQTKSNVTPIEDARKDKYKYNFGF